MRLGAPLGLLAAGLAAPLVLWYLLRSRRPRQVVASTFLWRTSERSVAAAIPWQRFRADLTFWLVLLALLLGAFALARPYLAVPAQLGDHTILIMDASGSMLADEHGPTRLELARREALDLTRRLSPGQEISIVEAGSRGRVLLSASDDPAQIRSALSAVRIGHGAADLVDAFTLAAALERPGQQTILHLYTDGPLPSDAVNAAPTNLSVTAVGTDRPNLAVTRLQAVPQGAGSSSVFAQIRNFGLLEAQATLTMSVDGEDVVSENFRLPPRGTVDRVLTVQGGDGDVLMARVEPRGQDPSGDDRRDALSIDDRAFTLLSAPREIAVTLATPGNVFLEAALSSVPGVVVTTVDRVPAVLDDTDLLVVDRLAAPASPTVPTMAIAATRWPAGVTADDEVELPTLSFQAAGHDLLTDVDLSGVSIAAATPLSAPALVPIAGGPQADLMLAGRLDGVPTLLVGFDLLRSNLPLQAGWPVMVANAMSWLAGPPSTVPVTAGTTVTLTVPAGATAVAVSPPGGDVLRLDPASPRLTVDQAGLWRLVYEGDDVEPGIPALAVNPNPDEGDLARGGVAQDSPHDPAVPGATAPPSTGRQPIGRLVLAGVLALAIAEWAWVFGVRPWRRRRAAAAPAADEPVLEPAREA